MNEHYVYMVKLGDEVVYVGSGKGDRYKHVTSGRSHNESLNLLHRQGIAVVQEFEYEGLTEMTARVLEQELIDKYKPLYNKGKAANEEKKALHKELSDELKRIRESAQPTEYARYMAKALFALWKATGNYHILQASFAVSRANPDSKIVITQNELSEFVSKYQNQFKDKMFFMQCKSSVGQEVSYITSVDEILDEINREESAQINFMHRQAKNFNDFVRLQNKALSLRGQGVLF
jgi:vacuolar-type H+-ATPase subunit I/STV1